MRGGDLFGFTLPRKRQHGERDLVLRFRREAAHGFNGFFEELAHNGKIRSATGQRKWHAGGQKYLGASPSRKSVKRIETKIGNLLVPGNNGSWPHVQRRLNGLLAGWSAYFSYGTLALTYRAVDRHVCVRVRRFLAKRHKVHGRGTRGFSMKVIFGKLGVHRLTRIRPRAAAVSLP